MRSRVTARLAVLALALLFAPWAPAAGDSAVGGAVRPVPGAVVRPFDPPQEPWLPGHRGVDLAAGPGEVVVAALDGTVSFAGSVAGLTWVTIAHGDRLRTTYGVFGELGVVPGQHVVRGRVLGRLVDGADHLDWGARLDGAYLDPMLLLRRWVPHLAPAPDAV